MSKSSSKSQKVKNHQNHTFTKDGVIWLISKMTKIHGLGMEIQFFMVRFLICICGLAFKMRVPFWVFKINSFCQVIINLIFEGSNFESIFQNFDFTIQYFDVKRSLQSLKKLKSIKIMFLPTTGYYG